MRKTRKKQVKRVLCRGDILSCRKENEVLMQCFCLKLNLAADVSGSADENMRWLCCLCGAKNGRNIAYDDDDRDGFGGCGSFEKGDQLSSEFCWSRSKLIRYNFASDCAIRNEKEKYCICFAQNILSILLLLWSIRIECVPDMKVCNSKSSSSTRSTSINQ